MIMPIKILANITVNLRKMASMYGIGVAVNATARRCFPLTLLCMLWLSCGSDDARVPEMPGQQQEAPAQETPPTEQTPAQETENALLQLNGIQLIDADQNPVYLQGVAFGNFIWTNTPEPVPHHTETDFERVRDMGMNAIRFYLNYRYFEDDANPYVYKQSGWDWLDRNIAWAKKHGIYLVLNMHVPQGGYQSQGKGDALWDDMENQNRLTALWKAIAERYKDEVQIAGFGPVNEPVPSTSMQQWTQLAQRLIDDIRAVDPHHLIFIEQAIYVKGNFEPDDNLNFPEVTGTNIIYEFHGYAPHSYTHQLFDWSGLGDGGKYPDESLVEVSNSEWYTATLDNPNLTEGTTDWTYFEGLPYTITDENIDVAVPALVGARVGGRVYFDDIVIKGFNEDGEFIRDVVDMSLDALDNWYYWTANDSGTSGLSTTTGKKDSNSLYIDGATGDSNLSNSRLAFIPQPGFSYQINGWMKGENVSTGAACNIRLDFLKANGPVLIRNKAYLEATLAKVVDWATSRNATLYMGEFGAGYPCFQDGKGGLQWVADMTEILQDNKIHFTYHSYHEDSFGLYLGNGLPDQGNVNQPLIDWFTENLN